MKAIILKSLFLLVVMTVGTYSTQAQVSLSRGAISEIDWTKNWVEYNSNLVDYPEHDKLITGNFNSNTILTSDQTYLLKGIVYVTGNSTLTIQPGTIIRCDPTVSTALVITKGSKLIAKGSKTLPIVFTSNASVGGRKPGDWGGIVLLGNAEVNTISGMNTMEGELENQHSIYGGNNENESSGNLSYVRIEFPGKKINLSKELNGLSLCGVGRGTILENIQISYSNDDSFEWFGGTCSGKNLVSYKCSDDDFDISYGFKGTLDNIIAVRHPLISDPSGSRSIEIDGFDPKNQNATKSHTICTINNATIVNLTEKNTAIFSKEAIKLDNDATLELNNSVITGFMDGIEILTPYKNLTINQSTINVFSNIFIGENVDKESLYSQYDRNSNSFLESSNIPALFVELNDKKINLNLRDVSTLVNK